MDVTEPVALQVIALVDRLNSRAYEPTDVETATLAVTASTMSQSPETTSHAAVNDPSPQRATSRKEAGTIIDIPKPIAKCFRSERERSKNRAKEWFERLLIVLLSWKAVSVGLGHLAMRGEE